MKRRNILNSIARKWYYLGQDEREKILLENEIAEDEEEMIVYLSSQIVKHTSMLKVSDKTNPQEINS